MKNYQGLKIGDRLRRNAYSVMHFSVGKEYEIETFVDGQPRVYGDLGEMVTITSQYNPKYFDHIVLPDPEQLRAGDLIVFTKDYHNFTSGKTYIVNKEDSYPPYVYDNNRKAHYLKRPGLFYMVVGKLSDMKPDRLADKVKEGDFLRRMVPGGQYHTKGKAYRVFKIHGGLVYVNTEDGTFRQIKADSEKNWTVVTRRKEPVTLQVIDVERRSDGLLAKVTEVRDAMAKDLMKLGITQETAYKAATEVMMKGLEGYERGN